MCWWRDEADRWNVGTMDREPAGRRAPYHRSIVPSFRSGPDRKSTRLNSSHLVISYAVFCLKKKKTSILFEITITSDMYDWVKMAHAHLALSHCANWYEIQGQPTRSIKQTDTRETAHRSRDP